MGRFGMPRGRAGMGRFAIQNAAWAGRGGGEGVSIAESLAGTATNVMAISFVDGSMVIRDTTTPANDYNGPYSSKLTINGSLPADPLGASFTNTNNATIATSAFCFSATEGSVLMGVVRDTLNGSTDSLRYFSFNDGTSSNVIDGRIYTSADPDNLGFTILAATVLQTSTQGGPVSLSGNTVFVGWEADNVEITVDGSGPGPDTSATIPTVSRLDIGYASWNASRGFAGRIKYLVYKPVREG